MAVETGVLERANGFSCLNPACWVDHGRDAGDEEGSKSWGGGGRACCDRMYLL